MEWNVGMVTVSSRMPEWNTDKKNAVQFCDSITVSECYDSGMECGHGMYGVE